MRKRGRAGEGERKREGGRGRESRRKKKKKRALKKLKTNFLRHDVGFSNFNLGREMLDVIINALYLFKYR